MNRTMWITKELVETGLSNEEMRDWILFFNKIDKGWKNAGVQIMTDFLSQMERLHSLFLLLWTNLSEKGMKSVMADKKESLDWIQNIFDLIGVSDE